MQFVLIVCQVEGYQNIPKLSYTPLAFTSYKAFSKKKRGLELVSLPHFVYEFWRKVFIYLYSINQPNFVAWLSLLPEILENMCIVIVC